MIILNIFLDIENTAFKTFVMHYYCIIVGVDSVMIAMLGLNFRNCLKRKWGLRLSKSEWAYTLIFKIEPVEVEGGLNLVLQLSTMMILLISA